MKPQFEAGKGRTDKGVVRDPASIERFSSGSRARARTLGLGTRDVIASPILGPEGNREFLVHLAAGPSCADLPARIAEVTGRDDQPHRLRVQPDHRGDGRARGTRLGLVPATRHRRMAGTERRPRGAARELPTTDALVVLGGDGTFLRAAMAVAEIDVPILGINLGKVGFLSKAEAAELEPVLEKISAGEFTLDERMVLEGHILRGGAAGEGPRHIALNDIVIARGSLARVCRLDVSIDDTHLATFIADGLVVASPTGSTGYSFSAGGPILDPISRNLVVTPIAAYLSAIRSVVVSPEQVVRCRVVDAHEALVSVDGRRTCRSPSATWSRFVRWSGRSG